MILENASENNLTADCGLYSEIAQRFSSEFEFAPELRREFRIFAEKRRKMTLIFKSGSQTYLDNRQIVFRQ